MLQKNTKADNDAIITDLRNEKEIYTGNRFLIYSLFPEQNISIQIIWGFKKQNIVINCGHSIINRTSGIDVGELMKKYGGGGHKQVGTCQVPVEKADQYLKEIVNSINNP